jgi:hypothetical protein
MQIARVLGLCSIATLLSSQSLADDKADKVACMDAASKGQTLRDEHKFIEAREQFRFCARQQCPGMVQVDCATWLDATEKSLPTIVIAAKDESGVDRFDVGVIVDGQPLVARLNGQAIPMNPGAHVFHFESADGTALDQHMIVREGEKNQNITAVFKRVPVTPTQSSNSWPIVGWSFVGVGIAGLAIGTILGGVAIGDKNSAHCNALDFCEAGPLSSMRSAAVGSDIGLIGGGILVATGAAILIFTSKTPHPETPPAESVSMQIAPWFLSNRGGLTLRLRY